MAGKNETPKAPSNMEDALAVIDQLNKDLAAVKESAKTDAETAKENADKAQSEIVELKNGTDDLKNIISEKDSQINSLKQNCEFYAKELEQKNELIDELKEAIDNSDTAVEKGDARPTIKIDSVTYSVNSGVKHQGVKYTAAELSQADEVCAELLKIEGQTVLTEIKK